SINLREKIAHLIISEAGDAIEGIRHFDQLTARVIFPLCGLASLICARDHLARGIVAGELRGPIRERGLREPVRRVILKGCRLTARVEYRGTVAERVETISSDVVEGIDHLRRITDGVVLVARDLSAPVSGRRHSSSGIVGVY